MIYEQFLNLMESTALYRAIRKGNLNSNWGKQGPITPLQKYIEHTYERQFYGKHASKWLSKALKGQKPEAGFTPYAKRAVKLSAKGAKAKMAARQILG